MRARSTGAGSIRRCTAPTAGTAGATSPWNVGALEVWYWSQKPHDLERVGGETRTGLGRVSSRAEPRVSRAGARTRPEDDPAAAERHRAATRRRRSRRLADNMLDYNPAATESLVQLMWGALLPGREGGLLNARLRYFDPDRKRAGVPEDVAALVSELSDTRTVVTLVNLNPSQPRTVIVQGGGYGEHQLVSVTGGGKTTPIDAPAADGAARSRLRTEARPGDEAIRQRADRAASVASQAALNSGKWMEPPKVTQNLRMCLDTEGLKSYGDAGSDCNRLQSPDCFRGGECERARRTPPPRRYSGRLGHPGACSHHYICGRADSLRHRRGGRQGLDGGVDPRRDGHGRQQGHQPHARGDRPTPRDPTA